MMIFTVLVMTGLLTAQAAAPQASDARAEAERLARTGAYAEALQRFEALAALNPDDLDARVWIGRLQQATGHPDRAADVFHSVLAAGPNRVDALVGLGIALTALDRPSEAIPVLDRAEKLAPDDPEMLAAQGRAHTAAGHARLALAYFQRAVLLRPADPVIREAHAEARRLFANRIALSGFLESYSTPTPEPWAGTGEVNVRLGDGLRVFARGQDQRKFGENDARGGGGLEFHPSRRWVLQGRALFGPDAAVLPQVDASGEAAYTRRRATYGLAVQYVDFENAQAWIVSPTLSIRVSERVAVKLRYSRSATEFQSSGLWIEGKSGLVGVAVRPWSRVWLDLAYTHGIEDFDTLSIDRLGAFNANGVRGSASLELPSLTAIVGTYEFQRREQDIRMLRATVGLVQRF